MDERNFHRSTGLAKSLKDLPACVVCGGRTPATRVVNANGVVHLLAVVVGVGVCEAATSPPAPREQRGIEDNRILSVATPEPNPACLVELLRRPSRISLFEKLSYKLSARLMPLQTSALIVICILTLQNHAATLHGSSFSRSLIASLYNAHTLSFVCDVSREYSGFQ